MKLLQKVSLYSLVASSSLLLWPVSKVQAHCKVWHPHHCSLTDIDPTRGIPGSKDFAENAWGEAGAVAYPAAASIMRGRHGSSQGLDSFQKRNLKPHFGDLVDQVVVIYNASMMDRWSALGKSINLSGVDTAAQTYCDRIYVRDPYKPNDLQQLELLAHELVHSRQCQSLGGAGKFGFHYFREFKRAGLGYDGNKLEKEADSFSKQIASSFGSSLSDGNIQEGNFHHSGSVYYSNGQGAYCGFNSPLHYRLSSTRPWGQWIEISAIPQSMRSDGSCRVIIREGNFHHNGSVYYSNGQGAYCGFTSPDHYKKKSGRRWGDWLEINEPLPFQTFMRYDGSC
jgi:hypothetical protein